MPVGEVAERHQVQVEAPVEDTFAAAREMNVNRSALVRAIFAARTLPARLRGHTPGPSSQSLLDETLALGWRVLAERPDREIVVGAVTQPWKAEVTFRGVDPEAFAAFAEPGYAKIVWTLEACAAGPCEIVLPHADPSHDHRPPVPRAVPPLLGGPLARHPAHPATVARTGEARGPAPVSPAADGVRVM